MNSGLKTKELSRETIRTEGGFKMKVSSNKQEARNMVSNENHNKKIEIGEQRMSREGPKKKRCTEIEDAKRKKHQRKAAETISA